MSLSFLVPAFLAGLVALAVPVLVHLTRRQTRTPLEFPSLMFVRRLPQRTEQRRRVHRWPLLLLRCAALAALVLAFTRPLLERRAAAAPAPGAGAREVVLLLDRSYSMGYGDRWQRATREAAAVLDGLRPGDRATLLLFDSRAEAASGATGDRAALRAALERARPGVRATRYAPALRYAQRLLSASTLPRRELVLVSDFQRSALQADAAEARAIRLPAGTTITPLSVADSQWVNATVASVEVRRTPTAGRERVAVTARLTTRGADGPPIPVSLELDGRTVQTRSVAPGASGAATVAFAPFVLPEGRTTRGTVRIPGDRLPADDAFHLALAPDPRVGVLVVEGGPGGAGYLRQALALGDAPGFRADARRSLRTADLAGRSVVVLDQAPFPRGEAGRRLRRFVEGGGGLVMVLGASPTGEWAGVVPDAGRAVDRSPAGGTTLGFVDLGHPVFEPFSTPRSGDFTATRVFQYRPIPAAAERRVLARFADGAAALTEQRVGAGRVLVWTSTLDGRWNDLAVQPVFLPLVHQLVKRAAGYAPAPAWLTLGDPVDPGSLRPAMPPSALAITPSGARLALTPKAPLALEEPGFYELRDRRTGARGATLAVNVDVAESRLDPMDPHELVGALTPPPAATRAAESVASLADRERQQGAWWYLVVLALLLLAAETLLSNRTGRGAAPARG